MPSQRHDSWRAALSQDPYQQKRILRPPLRVLMPVISAGPSCECPRTTPGASFTQETDGVPNMLLSKLIAARIAYGVDRAVQANLAVPAAVVAWEIASNATKQTWLRYITLYNSSGTVPTLGADVHRTSAFSAVMSVVSPRILGSQIHGQTSTFTLTPTSYTLDLSSDATHTLVPSLPFDAFGDAISGETYTFTSSDPAKASVNATTGVMTAHIVGSGIIMTCTASSGTTKTATIAVQA